MAGSNVVRLVRLPPAVCEQEVAGGRDVLWSVTRQKPSRVPGRPGGGGQLTPLGLWPPLGSLYRLESCLRIPEEREEEVRLEMSYQQPG